MMIKKKSSAKEEVAEEQENEFTENKDNREEKEPADQANDGEIPEDAPAEEHEGKTVTEAESTDKVSTADNTFEVKLAEMQDKYIRLSAEFDNYRKRTLREKMELTKYASENILLKILPFMDDFERALQNTEDAKDCVAVREGIALIHTKFVDFLKQNGVAEVEALNCAFNFDLHDAVAKVQVDDENMKGKIVDVVLKGYYLQDKVIRHSKVVVGE
jgi:molecular chaperone GrpE